jgi:hypothetical protein
MFANTTWNKGLPLTMYIDNPFEKRSEFETRLSTKQHVNSVFFMPPVDQYHSGFGIHFIAKTTGNQISSTTIKNFSMYPIPYSTINKLSFEKLPDAVVNQSYIEFGQSYNSGWKAYVNGKELQNHVIVNGWANGWELKESLKSDDKVTFSFWPQSLQYVGFTFIILMTCFILLPKKFYERFKWFKW